MGNNRILKPHYLQKFSCIGQKCEDNCCYGWGVYIDKDTFYKYRNINNVELKNDLRKNVSRNRSTPNNEAYGKLKMDKNCKCVFQEDGLCKIQKVMGAEYLSNVCSTYPRMSNIVDGVIETSATVSCPEIARLALLNPDIMEFDEFEDQKTTKKIIVKEINSKNIRNENNIIKYFWNLRVFSISLVQNRQYKLWERLILLGLFCKAVQNEIDNEKIESIPKVISLYENIIKDISIKEEIKNISSKSMVQINIIKKINDSRLMGQVPSKLYLKCVEEFLNGLQIYETSNIEDISPKYDKAYKLYYEPYFKDHEYILENYLVNYMFRNLFPFNSNGNIFDDYCKLVIHYSLIKMMLIGMSAYHKKLEDEIVIKLIYSFSRTIEHTNTVNDVFSDFKEQKFDNMAFMSVFIKN